ncbi:hypothetical protein EDC04DRAFT_2230296 [Pisolithus marmoratus]|nr:hypothetical protein EDC04DRAFT_2230296 [Pisolithus marmoratus]
MGASLLSFSCSGNPKTFPRTSRALTRESFSGSRRINSHTFSLIDIQNGVLPLFRQSWNAPSAHSETPGDDQAWPTLIHSLHVSNRKPSSNASGENVRKTALKKWGWENCKDGLGCVKIGFESTERRHHPPQEQLEVFCGSSDVIPSNAVIMNVQETDEIFDGIDLSEYGYDSDSNLEDETASPTPDSSDKDLSGATELPSERPAGE